MLWGVFIYGLWITVKAQASGRLSAAFYAFVVALAMDVGIFLALQLQWVEPVGDGLFRLFRGLSRREV